ncbi:MAG: hypothetical protein HYV09_19515 [Deltaproteobacteria bacterium]|nr:hypothetical protein [Deltaproteobacteria bacterium]
MTPSLAAVHDDMVAAAADPRLAPRVDAIRARFVQRVGPFAPSDPWFEERSGAFWDRVLVDAGVREALLAAPPPTFGADHREVLGALARAQRGLFEVRPSEATVDVVCVATGAAFRLAASDDAAHAMSRGGEGGWIDGWVIATREGVALLPGLLVHPAEATDPMRELVKSGLAFDDLLDALLAMRHRLASRSRMRARQVYRAEALPR